VRPKGNWGRVAILLSSSVLGVGGLLAIAIFVLTQVPSLWPALVPLSAGLLAYTWLWTRLPFLRLVVTDRELVIVSWWRTHQIPVGDVVRVWPDAYTGYFYVIGWPVASGVLEAGAVFVEARVNNVSVTFRAPVLLRSTATAQARSINNLLPNASGLRLRTRAKRSGRDGQEESLGTP